MDSYICELISVRDETHDAKIFRFKRPSELEFVSGQYCMVGLIDNSVYPSETRPFTFSSSPLVSGYFELTILKIDGFTEQIFSLDVGDKLKIKGPTGKALNFDSSVEEDVVFVAGGSGITPFMSAIRYAVEKSMKNNIVLFYSGRTEDDLICREEFENYGSENDNIKIVFTITRDVPAGWRGESGRLNLDVIKKYIFDLNSNLWYVCGPPAMNDAVRNLLSGAGVAENRIRIEPWEIEGKE